MALNLKIIQTKNKQINKHISEYANAAYREKHGFKASSMK